MNNEDFVREIMRGHNELTQTVGDQYLNMIVNTIKSWRELIKDFIVISSGIVGFSIPIFKTSNIIKSDAFFFGGLLLFVIVIVYGFYYLTNILQAEIKELYRQNDESRNMFNRLFEQHQKLFNNLNDPKAHKEWEDENTKILAASKDTSNKKMVFDNSLNIIFISFIMGMILLILSTLPADSYLQMLFRQFLY